MVEEILSYWIFPRTIAGAGMERETVAEQSLSRWTSSYSITKDIVGARWKLLAHCPCFRPVVGQLLTSCLKPGFLD